MRIRTKRIYEETSRMDGFRVLVDRIWPRGVSQDDAELDEWAKDLAPSDDLRKWFGHDEDKWEQFRRRYRDELANKRQDVAEIVEQSPKRTITLLYAARDEEHNNAVVLKDYIDDEFGD